GGGAPRARERKRPNVPRAESIAAGVAEIARRGVTAADVQGWLDTAEIVPVFTAHPTEARRRTTLERLRRVAAAVERLHAPGLLSHEATEISRLVEEEVVSLWQ